MIQIDFPLLAISNRKCIGDKNRVAVPGHGMLGQVNDKIRVSWQGFSSIAFYESFATTDQKPDL